MVLSRKKNIKKGGGTGTSSLRGNNPNNSDSGKSGKKSTRRRRSSSPKSISKSRKAANEPVDYLEGLIASLSRNDYIATIRDTYDKIKNNIGIGKSIVYGVEETQYIPKCPSKLDYLQFLLNNEEKIIERTKSGSTFYERNKDDEKIYSPEYIKIIKEGNIEELDKWFSLNNRTFFANNRIFLDTKVFEIYNPYEFNAAFSKIPFTKKDHMEWTEFVSFQISEEIKTMKHTYNITYNDNTGDDAYVGKITIHSPEPILKKDLSELLSNIISNILLFNYYFKLPTVPELEIYMCDGQKLMPEDNIFTGKNINSGFTSMENTKIFLFRKEELLKVLLHECFHAHRLLENVSSNIDKEYLVESIQGNQSKTETCVETLAEFLNVIINSTPADFGTKMKKEITYSLSQVAKILGHVGCKSFDEYYIPLPPPPQPHHTKIIETTNLHTYFVLKSQCMMYLNEFLSIVNFPNITANNLKLKADLDVFLNSKKTDALFVRTINSLIAESPSENKSLRMSIIE